MTDKLRAAAEMALSALEKAVSTTEDAAIRQSRCIYHLRQALAEPDTGIDRGAWSDVPDATKWVDELRGGDDDWDHPPHRNCECKHCIQYWSDVYPPKRECVGLTDEEIAEAVGSPIDEVYLADFRKVEAALKSKNGF